MRQLEAIVKDEAPDWLKGRKIAEAVADLEKRLQDKHGPNWPSSGPSNKTSSPSTSACATRWRRCESCGCCAEGRCAKWRERCGGCQEEGGNRNWYVIFSPHFLSLCTCFLSFLSYLKNLHGARPNPQEEIPSLASQPPRGRRWHTQAAHQRVPWRPTARSH